MSSNDRCTKDAARARLGLIAPEPVSEQEAPAKEEPKEEVVEDDDCQCVSDNDLPQTKRSGQKVIIYTDPSGIEHEYPAAYGTACIGWDEILPPTCGDGNGRPLADQPDWCPKPWCWINPKKCTKKDTQESVYFSGEGLYYSYSQCNAVDTFTDWDPNAQDDDEEADNGAAPATGGETEGDSTGSGAMSMAFTTAAMVFTSALMI